MIDDPLMIPLSLIILVIIIALACYFIGRNRGQATGSRAPPIAPPAPPK